MKVNIYVDTKINVGDIFYTIGGYPRSIVAHRCERIVVTYTIEDGYDQAIPVYQVKNDDHAYEMYEIYTSFEDAESVFYGDE